MIHNRRFFKHLLGKLDEETWRMKEKNNEYRHLFLLLLWTLIGGSLRFVNLTSKPPWIDEFATMVFSLGNTFEIVPLNRAISLDTLLQPLQINPSASIGNVIYNLVTQDTHPPLYFVLAHLWMQLFSPESGLVSLFATRSLPALFGAVSIPCAYFLGKLAFRSSLVGHLTAAMMAVSPYGIYIAQEARHYSLAILWVITSVTCLVIATEYVQQQKDLPIGVTLSWIMINFLGISTHYFFGLTLCTEVFWLIFLAWRQQRKRQEFSLSPWWQIYAVIVGTTVGGLIWLPIFLQTNHGSELTKWIHSSGGGLLQLINPIFQALSICISMVYLLPVSEPSLPVIIISGLAMLLFLIWLVPIIKLGIITLLKQLKTSLITQMFIVLVVGAIALFFIFAYVLRIDITRGARYYFIFFPSVIVFFGAILAVRWNNTQEKRWGVSGKTAVAIVLLMGLVSSVVVVYNFGYPKYYRPDLLVPIIQSRSTNSLLIATTHKTFVMTGEMMGIAREFKLKTHISPTSKSPLFLLAHQEQNPNTSTTALIETLQSLPRPLDLWLVNFYAPTPLSNCAADSQPKSEVNGYEYKLYHCQ